MSQNQSNEDETMKIFDYSCSKCEYTEEKFIETHGKAPETFPVFRCPTCDGMMSKLMSAPNLIVPDDFPGSYHKRRKGKNFHTENK